MKRVLFLINRLENKGPCNVLMTLLRNIDRSKVVPFVMSIFAGNNGTFVKELEELGISAECFDITNRSVALKRLPKLISKFCAENGIGILHSQCFFSDLICSKVIFAGKKISTLHNVCYVDYLYEYGRFKGKLLANLHIKILNKMDYVICCSESVYHSLKPKINSDICFVNNGADKKLCHYSVSRSDLGIDSAANVFIYVGSIDLRKNVRGLISKFVRNNSNDDYLLILGTGNDLSYCKKIANNHVLFLGFVENPQDYYYISDFYISNSFSEGLSLSQIDSLSFGLIQLVSNISSHKIPFKVHQYIGELFSENDFDEKFDSVKQNKNKVSKESIIDLFNDSFSGKVMSEKYVNFYEKNC